MTDITNLHERITRLETNQDHLLRTVASIDGKVDILINDHNKQQGAAKLLAIVWTGLAGLGGGWIWGLIRGHS